MKNRSVNHLALIIKSKKVHERDVILTILTKEHGKLTVVAKGVRQLNSSKKAYLEAGNLVNLQLIFTKGLPLLTQATLVSDTISLRTDFLSLKKLFLFLEILDCLLVNEQMSDSLWRQILYLRELLLKKLSTQVIQTQFKNLLIDLGFLDSVDQQHSVTHLVNQITSRQLCTYNFLQID